MRIKKIIALMLTFAMVVSGLYIVTPDTSEVKAAEATQSSSDVLEPNEVADGMLDVKMQIQTNQSSEKYADGTVNLRLVSSVNGLGYKNVGFEVCLDLDNNKEFDKSTGSKEYIKFTTGDVSKRINASVTGVTYNYSPKVIDTDAEYFVSGTLMGIKADYLSYTMCVKAFCTTINGETKYGTARYFNIEDATTENIINIPVAMTEEPDEGEDGKIDVTLAGTSTKATLEKYDVESGYAHLNVSVPDQWDNKTALPSASKIVVGSDENAPSAIYRNLLSDYTGGDGDTSWYDDNEEKLVIVTAADLYGFSTLASNGKTFSGKTIYMVADIDVNDGEASETGLSDGDDGTVYDWTPIADFAGTFDGQMHTISGVCFSTTAKGNWGLFGVTGDCTIQNLTLANSYMKVDASSDNRAHLGSIAGKSTGDFDTIKVAKDVYVQHTNTSSNTSSANGGIVGFVTGATNEVKISNCWFEGNLKAAKFFVGGIVGNVMNNTSGEVKIENCLYSGETSLMQPDGTYIGGLCGQISNTHATIDKCLSAGNVKWDNLLTSPTYIGAIIGYAGTLRSSCTDVATITNTYAKNSSNWGNYVYTHKPVTLDGVELSGVVNADNATGQFLSSDDCTGGNGYAKMNLDFSIKDIYEGVWTVTKTTPVLSSFLSDEEIFDLDEGTIPRTFWYTNADEGTTTYTLYSTPDMLGFAKLVKDGENFSEKTVKLGADITMNKGVAFTEEFASEESESGPFEWTPMQIVGTFDGDGHTISGVYVDAAAGAGAVGLFTTVSGTVQNLRLLNSYFKHNDATVSDAYNDTTNHGIAIGSIAGTLSGGTLDTVYSNAIVKHAGSYAGGLVGSIYEEGTTNRISNCCYTGTIEGVAAVGGILGRLFNTQVTIEHCLNTGTIKGGQGTGGFCGYIKNTSSTTLTTDDKPVLTVTDSLSVGRLGVEADDKSGAAIGFSHGSKGLFALLTNAHVVLYYKDGTAPWDRYAAGGNNATIKVDDQSYKAAVTELSCCWTESALINKVKTDGTTQLALSFQREGEATTDKYWVDRTGKIPMLASFEDLLENVTY